jgi:hypothetical protein
MAKQSVKQAREVADTFTRRIPKDLLTSGNCVTVPVGNWTSPGVTDMSKPHAAALFSKASGLTPPRWV